MISIRNLSIAAGHFRLNNIDLQVDAGKIHVLLGPTGSGKTLLLESIAGLNTPVSGTIHIGGRDMTHTPPEQRKLAYLPQDNALFPHLTVGQNMAFGLTLPQNNLSKADIRQKVSDIAALLDIGHLLERNIARLSGGERQRVALARALLLDHPLFILDEPTSSLHEAMQEDFFLLLREIAGRYQLTILLSTHHLDSAFLMADILHFIRDGQMQLSCTVADIFNRPLPASIAAYLGFSNILKWHPLGDGRYASPELNTTFSFPSFRPMAGQILQVGIRPVNLWLIRPDGDTEETLNTFPMRINRLLHTMNDVLVLLQHPDTGFSLRMQLSVHQLYKYQLQVGEMITCKVKAGMFQEIIPDTSG
jgi:ABC-type sugar transport system ATPase subunit